MSQDQPIKTPINDGLIQRVLTGAREFARTVWGKRETHGPDAPVGDKNTPPDQAWFGPGKPLKPTAPPETAGRAYDYPSAINLSSRPRQYEGLSFEQLRQLADSYDLLRLAIETRKDQMAKLSWSILPRKAHGGVARPKATPRCKEIEDFFRRPDRIHDWTTWLRMLLEDVFVIDAPALYVRRRNDGGLWGFEIIDGATISVRLSPDGRQPAPPEPAYQQILKGMPAVDYTADELIYRPRNPRPHKAYGMSPVEQIVMTVNIAIRRAVHQLQFYCYSDDTEFLTRRGWLRFEDCTPDDEFATRQIGTGVFEWQKAYDFFRKRYTGKMVRFSGRSLDLLVTPHHRMLVDSFPKALRRLRKPENGMREHVITAEEMVLFGTKNTGIPQTSVWHGEEISEIAFDDDDPRSKRVVMSGDDFCAFMGMYLAEGNLNGDSIVISQPKDERGAHEVYRQLLERIFGTGVSFTGHQFEVCRKALADYLRQFGKAHEKFIPPEILNATPRQMEIFWRYYYLGDGRAAGDNGKESQVVFTASRRFADDLTQLIQKMGYAPTVWTRPAGNGRVGDRLVNAREGYVITLGRRKSTRGWTAELVDYDGDVVCMCVPNKFLYVRRNGKAAWSGNTEGNVPEALVSVPKEWTLQQIEDFQKYWDALLEGNTAMRRHAKFVPGEMNVTFTRGGADGLKDDYDEWLARVICYAFSLPPLPFVKQMNRATAQTAQEAAIEEGLAPLMVWAKGLMDDIIERFFNEPDLEFVWDDVRELDPQVQAQLNAAYIPMGVKSVDEARADLGLEPLGMKHAIWGIGPLGITFIEDLIDPVKRAQLMPQPQMLDPFGMPIEPNGFGQPGGVPQRPGVPGQPPKRPPILGVPRSVLQRAGLARLEAPKPKLPALTDPVAVAALKGELDKMAASDLDDEDYP